MDRFDGVFMTVREPLARFRSEYAMRNTDDVAGRRRPGWTPGPTRRSRRYAATRTCFDNHLRPQAEF